MEKGICTMNDPSGLQVAINAHQVRCVKPTGDPQVCYVCFDGDHSVAVAGTFVQIVAQLRSALE
jgi:hypothetical protein